MKNIFKNFIQKIKNKEAKVDEVKTSKEEINSNIICITGNVGAGKTKIISELEIDKDKTIILDFKGDIELSKNFIDSTFISFDSTKNNENILNILKEEIKLKEPKFIIIDDAQALTKKELMESFKEVLDTAKSLSRKPIFILGSQEKLSINEEIKYFEMNNLSQAEEVIQEVNNHIKFTSKEI